MSKASQKFPASEASSYFRAYLFEKPEGTFTRCVFSKKPFTPEQFTSLFMGVMEAYAEQLKTTNSAEAIYENFNNAFGIFLAKILPEDKIYEVSKEHKVFKERVDATLGQPEDAIENANNRLAATLLARDILINEGGMTEESADLLLNRRLELIKKKEGGDGESDEETTEKEG